MLASACVHKCVCDGLVFDAWPPKLLTTSIPHRGELYSRVERRATGRSRYSFYRVFVKATSVVTMLEYNWYGQVSEN